MGAAWILDKMFLVAMRTLRHGGADGERNRNVNEVLRIYHRAVGAGRAKLLLSRVATVARRWVELVHALASVATLREVLSPTMSP